MSVEIHTDKQLADSPVLQAVFGEALPKIEVFHGKLQAEGEERGLIGPRDVDIIWERHLLNSAAIVPFVAEKTEGRQFKTVADLEGKKVSVGAPASGVFFNAVDVLTAYGLGDMNDKQEFTKIDATYQSFQDSAEALKDGQIDAAFIVAGAPTTAVTDLASGREISLVSLDDEHINALIAACPYYSKNVISKDVYNLAEDTTTVAVGAVVIARDDVSDVDVYNFLYGTFEDVANLSHGKAAELNLDFAASVTSIGYHPGAVAYFADKGITVPAKG